MPCYRLPYPVLRYRYDTICCVRNLMCPAARVRAHHRAAPPPFSAPPYGADAAGIRCGEGDRQPAGGRGEVQGGSGKVQGGPRHLRLEPHRGGQPVAVYVANQEGHTCYGLCVYSCTGIRRHHMLICCDNAAGAERLSLYKHLVHWLN
jgi:hypothetical protein